MSGEGLTRPIIGIENRTPQEVFDIMCDRITRASAWRPIESAPKDGTLILISGTITGSWHGRGPRPTPEPFIGTAYFAHGLWQTGQLSGPPDPTHWMPLPPTPQGEG